MESINIFTQDSYFAITLFTLGLLLFSTIFSSRADKIAAPLWLLFIGLAVEFVAGGVSARAENARRGAAPAPDRPHGAGYCRPVWV